MKFICLDCGGEFDEDEAVFVTNDKGEREEIDLPESMTYELDSLLYDYHQKTYLSPDESCNLPDVNPSFTDEEIISREDILHLNAGYEIMGRCSMYGHEYYACEKILPASTET